MQSAKRAFLVADTGATHDARLYRFRSPKHSSKIRSVTCPFSGEVLAATPTFRPDLAIIRAQKADRKGNIDVWHFGCQKKRYSRLKSAIVTVEEIVDDLHATLNSCVLPHWVLTYVCEVPGGARPSYPHGYYNRDNAFCIA